MYLYEKTHKEHRRLYYNESNGKWLKSDRLQQSDSSLSSSPLEMDSSSLDTQSLNDMDADIDSNRDCEYETEESIGDIGKLPQTHAYRLAGE